jgi:hypothetical protein
MVKHTSLLFLGINYEGNFKSTGSKLKRGGFTVEIIKRLLKKSYVNLKEMYFESKEGKNTLAYYPLE